MAHRHNDPYGRKSTVPALTSPASYFSAEYVPPQAGYNTKYPHDYDDQSNWDAKSYQSSYAGSQAHLNPTEMTQVTTSQHHIPPVPSLPYHPMYPPQNAGLRPQQTGWSDARDKLLKRRSVRQVQLFQGNLVLDVPVPASIIPAGMGHLEEMSKMRYTAATCDPDDFMASKFSLRPYLYKRHTELFIVMTMYNEDEFLFVKTMNACVPSLIFFSLFIRLSSTPEASSKTLPIFVAGTAQRSGVKRAGKR